MFVLFLTRKYLNASTAVLGKPLFGSGQGRESGNITQREQFKAVNECWHNFHEGRQTHEQGSLQILGFYILESKLQVSVMSRAARNNAMIHQEHVTIVIGVHYLFVLWERALQYGGIF